MTEWTLMGKNFHRFETESRSADVWPSIDSTGMQGWKWCVFDETVKNYIAEGFTYFDLEQAKKIAELHMTFPVPVTRPVVANTEWTSL